MERAIATEMPEKVVILVLTKIDLVPKSVLAKTLALLHDDLPVLLWKSGQLDGKKRFHAPRATAITHSRQETAVDGFTFGAESLLASLRSLQQKKGGPLTVGVVGFPKVGRSQLIARLCESSPLFQSDGRNSAELNAVGLRGVCDAAASRGAGDLSVHSARRSGVEGTRGQQRLRVQVLRARLREHRVREGV